MVNGKVRHKVTGAAGTVVGTFTTNNPYLGELDGPWFVVCWADGETFSVAAHSVDIVEVQS